MISELGGMLKVNKKITKYYNQNKERKRVCMQTLGRMPYRKSDETRKQKKMYALR
jgi:hypothetical protein